MQHVIYLYNYAGQPWKAQYWVREIMNHLYNSSPAGYCGDEDTGQTSAWYIFSALGFYPVTPATNQYVIGAPLFKKATVELTSGKRIVINADKNSVDNRYIAALTINGKPYLKNWLNYHDLVMGAKLDFKMSALPDKKRGIADKDAPYSFSNK